MGAFGDKLRREREMRGITLSEISESTKISKRWLQALEDEQFDQLPGGVFNRGFVRAYARFLGINDEQAVADYIAASNEQEPPEDKFPLEIHEKKRSDAPPLNPKRSFVPILFAIVALVLVVGGWTVWVKRKPQNTTVAPQPSRSNAPAAASQAPANVQTATPAPRQNDASSAPATKSQATPDDTTDNQASPATPAKTAESPHVSAGDPKQNGPISVVIKARKDSWISIVADGQTLWEGTLNASKERSIQADKELVLKTGNAAGIDVSYNGKPIGILGKEKEVRTITFNTAGLQQ
ncbi:MAG TPA: RodZ domain-containing protein [Candidatus Angelobacter sp.]